LAAGISFGNIVLIARGLGVEGRGEIAFLTAIATTTAYLGGLGVQDANANFAGMTPGLRRALASNSLLLAAVYGGVAIILGLALFAAIPSIGGTLHTSLISVALFNVPLLILRDYFQLLLQADHRFTITNMLQLVMSIGNLVVNVALLLTGIMTVLNVMVVWMVIHVLVITAFVWYIAARGAGFGRPDLSLARSSTLFGLQSQIGGIMQIGIYRLDHWLVGAIAGTRELGYYSIAVDWSESLWYLPSAVASVQRPRLVRASRREAVVETLRGCRMALLATLPLAVGMFLFAPLLCAIALGAEYYDASQQLRVLVLGVGGVVTLKLLGHALLAQGLPMLETISIGMSFITMLGLDLLLIPEHGALGAAVASTLSYTVGGIFVSIVFARVFGAGLREFLPQEGELSKAWLAVLTPARKLLFSRRSR